MSVFTIALFFASISHFHFFNRINKRGSQKDEEQKKSGNYFFYDNSDDNDGDDFDDI